MFPRIVAGAALPYRGHESISKDRHARSASTSASASASAKGSSQSPRSQSKSNQSSQRRPWWRMLPYMQQQQLQEGSDKDLIDSDDDSDSDGDSSDVSSEGGSLFAYELPKLIPALTIPTTTALREQWSSPSSSSTSLSPSSLVAASLTAESLPPVVVPPPVLSWPRVSLFRGFKVRHYQSMLTRHVT